MIWQKIPWALGVSAQVNRSCSKMARKGQRRWLNSKRLASGTMVWTSEAPRGLNRVSNFKGIFLTAREMTKGVQAFHGNFLFDWLLKIESFATIIISMRCLMGFFWGAGVDNVKDFAGEAGRRVLGKRSYKSPILFYTAKKIAEHPASPGACAWSWTRRAEVQYLVLTSCLLLAKPTPASVSPFLNQC